ncbi:MAG TPA: hypothetical protein VGM86_17475 [Thermoanaerobaculia bacterium]|jgi:hypothetical protein
MSQSAQTTAQAADVAVTPSLMLGRQEARFTFIPSSNSTQTQRFTLSPPDGTQTAVICLQEFDVQYTNRNHFDFGQLRVSLSTSRDLADCTVTLRDDKINERQWEGTVTGLVMFFGK